MVAVAKSVIDFMPWQKRFFADEARVMVGSIAFDGIALRPVIKPREGQNALTSNVANYIYILASTGVLTVATAGWPTAAHVRLAIITPTGVVDAVVSQFASRKFTIAICGVGAILLLVILAAVLQKFAGIDLGQYLPWAVSSVAGLCGISSGTIAWEDVVTKKTAASQPAAPQTTD